MTPGDFSSFEQDHVTPSLQSRYRSGYDVSSTNIALVDEVGSAFEVDQPNRSPNSSIPKLDWEARTVPKGPAVDANGVVISTKKATPSPPNRSKTLAEVKSRVKARASGRGSVTVEGAVGAVGIGLVAYDLYNAKDNKERVEIAENTVVVGEAMALISEIPVVGQVVDAGIGSLAFGAGIGRVLSERVIPDSAQIAYGRVTVRTAFGASTGDLEIVENLDVLGWHPFKSN